MTTYEINTCQCSSCIGPSGRKERLIQVVKKLIECARPVTRKRIIRNLETAKLCTDNLYKEGAMCLLGTALPRSRRMAYSGVGTIDSPDYETLFACDDLDQSDIYRAWDNYATEQIEEARAIALTAAKEALNDQPLLQSLSK